MTQFAQASHTAADLSRVLTQALAEAALRLGLGSTDLGQIVGLSQPTSSRLLHGKYALAPGGKDWELAAHFVRLYRSLSSLVGGDDELARVWLNTANAGFDGQRPLDAIRRVDGLLHACEYLDSHRARV
ncbi:MAG: DUF2384 domain-containing protein [Rhodocyclaceae bacterium]|nr:DUF2384 domain-containing protein [Rhodocyclaceae bacterium]MBX3666849.1 DUF2384 domain-containing protein [Rhodocyclaceae bacterium]